MKIYLGVPQIGGVLPAAARASNVPVMISANAFRPREGKWRTVPDQLRGMDVALDSAGFVAMKLYGGFPFSPDQYAQLAADLEPTWWAQMDFCCEPEITKEGAGAVAARQWLTTWHLQLCREAAARFGASMPMPVIQGWSDRDYVDHAKEIDGVLGGKWPALVGVGSVCRRHLNGDAGVLGVVDALDRALPGNVKLHLFGVKSTAAQHLVTCPRVESIDSMAWDMAARRAGKTQVQQRAEFMLDWFWKQCAGLQQRRPFQRRLFD